MYRSEPVRGVNRAETGLLNEEAVDEESGDAGSLIISHSDVLESVGLENARGTLNDVRPAVSAEDAGIETARRECVGPQKDAVNAI
jgi:hypothetical protein